MLIHCARAVAGEVASDKALERRYGGSREQNSKDYL
jgi:hypothetical protein